MTTEVIDTDNISPEDIERLMDGKTTTLHLVKDLSFDLDDLTFAYLNRFAKAQGMTLAVYLHDVIYTHAYEQIRKLYSAVDLEC